MTNPSKNIISVDDALYDYIINNSVKESSVLQKLREKTDEHILGGMRITRDQGQFLAFLVHVIQAEQIMEIGVYTGYSTLWLASALGKKGRITALETRREFIEIGKNFWE